MSCGPNRVHCETYQYFVGKRLEIRRHDPAGLNDVDALTGDVMSGAPGTSFRTASRRFE